MPYWQNGNARVEGVALCTKLTRHQILSNLKTVRITLLHLRKGGGGWKLDLKEARTFRIIIKPSTFAHWIATSEYALDKWVKWPLCRLFCSLKELLVDWYWFLGPPYSAEKDDNLQFHRRFEASSNVSSPPLRNMMLRSNTCLDRKLR